MDEQTFRQKLQELRDRDRTKLNELHARLKEARLWDAEHGFDRWNPSPRLKAIERRYRKEELKFTMPGPSMLGRRLS